LHKNADFNAAIIAMMGIKIKDFMRELTEWDSGTAGS